jgi:asparagine synthase (glutamine-hydrolysing)
VYAAVKLAHQDGIKVMFTGQGADELFGGYSWYAKVADKEGYRQLRKHMIEDLLLLYKETLEREDKITMAHSIELREPFLDAQVIRVSLGTSMRLNVKGADDALGKHIHRKLAQSLGIPKDIAYRVKEAAQHGSGMHDTIDAIATLPSRSRTSTRSSQGKGLGARSVTATCLATKRYGLPSRTCRCTSTAYRKSCRSLSSWPRSRSKAAA